MTVVVFTGKVGYLNETDFCLNIFCVFWMQMNECVGKRLSPTGFRDIKVSSHTHKKEHTTRRVVKWKKEDKTSLFFWVCAFFSQNTALSCVFKAVCLDFDLLAHDLITMWLHSISKLLHHCLFWPTTTLSPHSTRIALLVITCYYITHTALVHQSWPEHAAKR